MRLQLLTERVEDAEAVLSAAQFILGGLVSVERGDVADADRDGLILVLAAVPPNAPPVGEPIAEVQAVVQAAASAGRRIFAVMPAKRLRVLGLAADALSAQFLGFDFDLRDPDARLFASASVDGLASVMALHAAVPRWGACKWGDLPKVTVMVTVAASSE